MLVRILEIPRPTGNFHFGGGEPQSFVEVDWFRDDPDTYEPGAPPQMISEEGRARVAEYIKGKRYYDPSKAYLVLHQEHTFTINYKAP